MSEPTNATAACLAEGHTPHQITHSYAEARPLDIRLAAIGIATSIQRRDVFDKPGDDPVGEVLVVADRIAAWISTGTDPAGATETTDA